MAGADIPPNILFYLWFSTICNSATASRRAQLYYEMTEWSSLIPAMLWKGNRTVEWLRADKRHAPTSRPLLRCPPCPYAVRNSKKNNNIPGTNCTAHVTSWIWFRSASVDGGDVGIGFNPAVTSPVSHTLYTPLLAGPSDQPELFHRG
eukprot:3181459-Rhodomonas_salina.2